jgi:hypothetical protein
MHEGLAVTCIAGEELAFEFLLADTADVLGNRDRMAFFIVGPRDPQYDGRDLTAFLSDDALSFEFGAWIIPGLVLSRI